MAKKRNEKYDMIVIGAGSAGLTYAIGACGIGAKVLLIEKDKIGGDCTHHGCVPSKALIHLAKEVRVLRKFEEKINVSMESMTKRVQKIVDCVYSHETPSKIQDLGVDVKIGDAKFIDSNIVSISSKDKNGKKIEEQVSGKKIIIATGSRARDLEIKGLETKDIITNKEIFNFTQKSIAIIGCGPIGCEISQALSVLGVKVYLINNSNQILAREDKKAAKLVEKSMSKDGVEIMHNRIVLSGKKKDDGTYSLSLKDTVKKTHDTLHVDSIFASVGRVPNIENLGLEDVGVEFDSRGVFVNSSMKTNVSNIYAIGDVARNFQFTHYANHMAKVALAKSIFKIPSKVKTDTPRITFTTPEIASIGNLNLDTNLGEKELFLDFSKVDRAICEGKEGFFKVICHKNGTIKGAVLVGENSSELINEIAVMIDKKISVVDVSNIIHPYPSYGYGLRNMFDQFRRDSYTESKKNIVQKVFGLGGK